jgi:hypothetical protein
LIITVNCFAVRQRRDLSGDKLHSSLVISRCRFQLLVIIVLSVVVSLAFAFQLTSRLTPAASKPGDLKAAPWQGAAAAVIDPVFSIPRLDVRYQVPNDALFVWCSRPNRFFDFGNYLGVMSAIRNMSPDNVVLYYDAEPPVDDKHYHTWLAEIADNFPSSARRNRPQLVTTIPHRT